MGLAAGNNLQKYEAGCRELFTRIWGWFILFPVTLLAFLIWDLCLQCPVSHLVCLFSVCLSACSQQILKPVLDCVWRDSCRLYIARLSLVKWCLLSTIPLLRPGWHPVLQYKQVYRDWCTVQLYSSKNGQSTGCVCLDENAVADSMLLASYRLQLFHCFPHGPYSQQGEVGKWNLKSYIYPLHNW